MSPRVVCIIQARMGSTRLPGKIMKDLGGETVLTRCVSRIRRARRLDAVVIATTTDPRDAAVESFCREKGWPVHRGSEADVLDRYYGAACRFEADVIVRITSDCPFIDPSVTDSVIHSWLDADAVTAYASNILPTRTYPRGLDTEVFSFEALKAAWTESTAPHHREHVTPFIWEQPARFPQQCVTHETDESALRWTIDTPEDLDLARQIIQAFGGRDDFSWLDALRVMNAHPEWRAINQHIEQKTL